MSNPAYSPKPSTDQAKLIDDLGGPKAVADAINAKYGTNFTGQCVSNWKRRGIPYRWRGPLVVLAQSKDISAPADFFGVSEKS